MEGKDTITEVWSKDGGYTPKGTSGVQPAEPKKWTRRKFLKYGGAFLVPFAAGIGIGAEATEGTNEQKELLKQGAIKPWEIREVKNALKDSQTASLTSQPEVVAAKPEESPFPKSAAFESVFKDLPEDKRKIVEEKVSRIKKTLTVGQKEMAVTAKWEKTIRQNALQVNFPEELALGIILIENGGGEDKKSPAGARGIAQLKQSVAKEYGLRINQEVDERRNPEKNIKVMCDYLKDLSDRFAGNLGLTVWAYHAGPTNVYDALREYSLATLGVDPGNMVTQDYGEALKRLENYRRLIKAENLSVFDLLSNSQVQKNVLSKLEDETNLYVYKVVAGAELFAENSESQLASQLFNR